MNTTSEMPAWVTIDEAVNIINSRKKNESLIKSSDLYRYALYGNLTFSIYFQSPVKLRRIAIVNNTAEYIEVSENITERLCYLCHKCFINNDNLVLKTEGEYISPSHNILDASLHGHEYAILQKLLARSLGFPDPVTGLYNIHHGVLVKDENNIYQVFELTTWKNRISRKLKNLPVDTALHIHEKLINNNALNTEMRYFPVYHFPDDACFVIRQSILEKFIDSYFPSTTHTSPKITTPLSRLLWLACKNNNLISSLIDHPYKLISVFEQWAASEGITDRLSGDTLKKALKRGRP
ncbi:hypothetical protein [Intestinirhabdus alba]|jgi:hypothetical protein|uniref:Uncharacterized protein n=1 Tax=Intestinirhabdus alba TaxID=2899544 RepID=A0A6L6IRD9_9ENTR|nr:hypothetical protein [Intestinirhabdus alba]MTH48288.1 hypothetical protein [Intestinirhabdus alba]